MILKKLEEMGGSDLKMVKDKKLFASDIRTSGCRFSLPLKQIKTDEFLTQEERNLLDYRDNPYSMPIIMIDTTGYTIEGIEF